MPFGTTLTKRQSIIARSITVRFNAILLSADRPPTYSGLSSGLGRGGDAQFAKPLTRLQGLIGMWVALNQVA